MSTGTKLDSHQEPVSSQACNLPWSLMCIFFSIWWSSLTVPGTKVAFPYLMWGMVKLPAQFDLILFYIHLKREFMTSHQIHYFTQDTDLLRFHTFPFPLGMIPTTSCLTVRDSPRPIAPDWCRCPGHSLWRAWGSLSPPQTGSCHQGPPQACPDRWTRLRCFRLIMSSLHTRWVDSPNDRHVITCIGLDNTQQRGRHHPNMQWART